MEELIQAFSVEHISKSGARFDYEKAKWFNQRYIQTSDNAVLAEHIRPLAESRSFRADLPFLTEVAALMKERVTFLPDFVDQGYYLFGPVKIYDEEMIRKKWNPAFQTTLEALAGIILPVSYTHLDVYKRQVPTRLITALSPAPVAAPAISTASAHRRPGP